MNTVLHTLRGSASRMIQKLIFVMAVSLVVLNSQAAERINPLPIDGRGDARTSYSVLAGEWYNWLVQFPFSDNPIQEQGAVDCARGQRGNIWFLAGNFGGVSHRSCTIPGGRFLFFPVINIIFWGPEDGPTVDAVRKLSNASINTTTSLEVLIDGGAIPDMFGYRAQSLPGGFVLEEGPLLADFGYTPGPRFPSVADGYWILLPPLPPGKHTIRFRSANSASFSLDVTYLLTVR